MLIVLFYVYSLWTRIHKYLHPCSNYRSVVALIVIFTWHSLQYKYVTKRSWIEKEKEVHFAKSPGDLILKHERKPRYYSRSIMQRNVTSSNSSQYNLHGKKRWIAETVCNHASKIFVSTKWFHVTMGKNWQAKRTLVEEDVLIIPRSDQDRSPNEPTRDSGEIYKVRETV